MMEEILVCENLTMTFDDGEYIVHALKNVSFSLRKNEVLGIIGESGSGKSTIAKLITGLYQPTGGNIFLGGRSIVRLKRQAQKIASEQLGRAVTIGEVDFKPWTLELTLRNLAVAGAAGAPPQLQIQRAYVDADIESLFRLAPVMDAIQVDAPVVRLRRRRHPGQVRRPPASGRVGRPGALCPLQHPGAGRPDRL